MLINLSKTTAELVAYT